MEFINSKTSPPEETLVAGVHKELMDTLQASGPLPIEDIVKKLPQFRWVAVLKTVSWLWGQGRLELEEHQGRLLVWALGSRGYIESRGTNQSNNAQKDLELTAL